MIALCVTTVSVKKSCVLPTRCNLRVLYGSQNKQRFFSPLYNIKWLLRARVHSREKHLLVLPYPSVRPSVRPHVSSALPLDGLKWNLIFGISTGEKNCLEPARLFKIGQKNIGTFTWKPNCVGGFFFSDIRYAEQQNRERISVLTWKCFQYSLHCWQRRMHVNNTNGTYFYVSVSNVVKRNRNNVTIYRVAHEKPVRLLVDQRGRRSRTVYRKLNKCKCKVLTG